MTRFGEISPLRHNFKKFLTFLSKYLVFWQNCEPTLANISHLLGNFLCSKWPNIEIIR